jgi:hypothetical protein
MKYNFSTQFISKINICKFNCLLSEKFIPKLAISVIVKYLKGKSHVKVCEIITLNDRLGPN